jgi:hypothetical protein
MKEEANRRWPNRKKGLDGTIGDAEHAARKSDHNPDAQGIVHAFDLTHDPANGVDCDLLAAHLVKKRDKRVKKIIWNRREVEPPDWVWKPYTGAKPHTTHMHVSVKYTADAENDLSPWWNLEPKAPTEAQYLQNNIHQAIASGNWARAFTLLNGLSMTHMLELLDSVNVQELVDRRTGYSSGVNMPRIEYAMYVVQNRQLPAAAPGDLPQTGQVEEARAFLGTPKKDSASGSVSPPTGQPLAPGQRRPLPAGYGLLRPTPSIVVTKANELLRTNHPIGTHIPLTIEGKHYLFAVEWHKHPATDPVPEKLKKWHRGISVYVKQ